MEEESIDQRRRLAVGVRDLGPEVRGKDEHRCCTEYYVEGEGFLREIRPWSWLAARYRGKFVERRPSVFSERPLGGAPITVRSWILMRRRLKLKEVARAFR